MKIFEIEKQIQELNKRLSEEMIKFKYSVYCQDNYQGHGRAVLPGTVSVGYIPHTETVYADNTNKDGYCYTNLYGNNLIDLVVYAGKCKAIVYNLGETGAKRTYATTRVCSFIRRYETVLRNHPDTEKLQSLLATCEESNLQLVKQLICAYKK